MKCLECLCNLQNASNFSNDKDRKLNTDLNPHIYLHPVQALVGDEDSMEVECIFLVSWILEAAIL